MKFTGFVSSVAGKALLIIFCILLGIVLAVGGEALAGYIILTKEGMMGTIADSVQERLGEDSDLQIQFDDETKAMSILQWGTAVVGSIGDLGGSTIGGLEKLIGLNIISSTIEDIVGVDSEVIQDSTLSGIGATITDNLTLTIARDKFGIEFPDLPIFEDEEFLAKPLSSAFAGFDEFTIGQIIEIEEDANVILKKMQDLKINELGGSKTNEIINDTELGEVIEITEESNAVLKKLQHTKIGDLGGSTTTDTINDMELGEVIEIGEDANAVLKKLQHTKIGDLGGSTTTDTINNMELGEVIEIGEDANAVLKKLQHTKIGDLGGSETSDTINGMELGEVIEIGEDSNAILKELQHTHIGDLGSEETDAKIKGMFMDEIMTIGEDSPETLKTLRYACIESQYEAYPADDPTYPGQKKDGKDGRALVYKTKNYAGEDRPLKGISESIDEMRIKDVVKIDKDSSAILRKMRTPTEQEIADGDGDLFGTEDLLVSELGGGKVNAIIEDTTIGEVIEVDGTSEPILQALAGTKIGALNGRMQTLKLSEVFDTTSLEDGALSMIDPDTTLPDIPVAVTNVMLQATVATMVGKGIISASSMSDINDLKAQQRAFMYNSTISDMLSGVIEFIKDPYTLDLLGPSVTIKYEHVSPAGYTVTNASFASLTAFVAAYSQYGSVSFPATVTVTVNAEADAAFYNADEECYMIPIMNCKSSTAFTISGGVVKLAVYDIVKTTDDGFAAAVALAYDHAGNKYTALARNQYGYAYVVNTTTGYFSKGFNSLMIASVASGDIE